MARFLQCLRCKEFLPIEQFYKWGNVTNKRYEICVSCRTRYQREYYARNRDKCNLTTQRYNDALRLEVFKYYSSEIPFCAICGEKDSLVLNLDHVDGGGEQHRQQIGKMGQSFYRWVKNNGFPVGYQVLCANCNMRKWKKEIRGIE